MTAINCSAEQRELQDSWTRTELGLTGEMGPKSRGMYTWTPVPSRPLAPSLVSHARSFFLSFSLSPLGPPEPTNSDATSLGSQMEDPVPGTERVKHRLKPCFPSRNRWENNGPTGPKVSDKCSTRVAGPDQARSASARLGSASRIFLLRLREASHRHRKRIMSNVSK